MKEELLNTDHILGCSFLMNLIGAKNLENLDHTSTSGPWNP